MRKPRQFGNYWLLDRINVGGMAEVWKAKAFGSNGFERIVAIKRILPNIAEDQEFITMFVDEAKISVQLTHPNIAQVTDLARVDDQYFIAMEYIQGKDLRSIFDRLHHSHTPMEIAQACYVTMKACEGLDYAHNKKDNNGQKIGIIHRDVSPQNVLVSFEGDVKIIDFGIAKAAGKASQTQAGILKGKFGYMSPEQVRGLQLDHRSDIFSLGIILYELLTNERLFMGESDFSTLEKVRNAEILPPTAYNRSIPQQLEDIMLRALAKDVEDRYYSAMEFHEQLQAFMFANGWFYSRKDLADWMKREFKKDIEEDKKKMEEYAQYTYDMLVGMAPQGGSGAQSLSRMDERAPSAASPRVAAAPPSLKNQEQQFWDDDELETSIHEKNPRPAEERVPRRKGAPAPVRKTLMGMSAPPLPGQQPDLSDLFSENDPTPAGVEYAESRPAAPSMPAMAPMMSEPVAFSQPLVTAPAPAVFPSAIEPASSGGGGKTALIMFTLFACLGLAGFLVWWFVIRTPGVQESQLEIRASSEGPCSIRINDQVLQDAQGKPLTQCSFSMKKPHGQYRIDIQSEGFLPYSTTVNLSADYAMDVQLVPAIVKMYIDGVPRGAAVQINDKPYSEKTPWTGMSFQPGTHSITVSHPDFHSYSTTETKQANEEIRIQYALLPKKVTLTIPVMTQGSTVCIVQSPTEEPLPAQCQVTPNAPYVFEPQPNLKYFIRVSRRDHKPVVLPMNLEGVTLWSPPAVIALERAEPAPTPDPPTTPVDMRPPVVVVVPMPVDMPADMPMDVPSPMEMTPVMVPMPPDMVVAATGTLRLNSRPTAQIMIGGSSRGYTPARLDLPAGTHKITLVNNDQGLRKTVTVTIRAGETTTELVRFE